MNISKNLSIIWQAAAIIPSSFYTDSPTNHHRGKVDDVIAVAY